MAVVKSTPFVDHDPVLAAAQTVARRGAPRTEVRLACSSFNGVIINGRYLKQACRNRLCREPGCRTYHYWDLVTGALVETVHEARHDLGAPTTAQGE